MILPFQVPKNIYILLLYCFWRNAKRQKCLVIYEAEMFFMQKNPTLLGLTTVNIVPRGSVQVAEMVTKFCSFKGWKWLKIPKAPWQQWMTLASAMAWGKASLPTSPWLRMTMLHLQVPERRNPNLSYTQGANERVPSTCQLHTMTTKHKTNRKKPQTDELEGKPEHPVVFAVLLQLRNTIS